MSQTLVPTRAMLQLRTGAKVCLLVAGVFLIGALYCLLVPINMPTSQGVFGCGSALKPPSDPFAIGVCQDLAVIQQLRVGALAAAGLLVAGLGFVLFGADRVARPAQAPERDPAATDEH